MRARCCLYAMPVDGDLGGFDCLTPENTAGNKTLFDCQHYRSGGTAGVNKQVAFAVNRERRDWSTITDSFADKFTIIDPEFQNALSLVVAEIGTAGVNKQVAFAVNRERRDWSTITDSFADKFTIIDPEFQNALSLVVA